MALAAGASAGLPEGARPSAGPPEGLHVSPGRSPGTAVYRDGPPPGHTGGFGEPTCRECHFDGPLNAPAGSLSVAGFPERWAPGERYPLTVRLAHPRLARGGFQLAVRWTEGPCGGASAGTLEPVVGEPGRATTIDSGRVRYLQHTLAGSRPEDGGEAVWRAVWMAPGASTGEDPSPAGPVALHVAANAANGDDSEFGDFVYVRSLESSITGSPTRGEGTRWPVTACRTRSTSRSGTSSTPPTYISR